MKRTLILGVGGVVAFGASGVVAVHLLTRDSTSASSAGSAAGIAQQEDAAAAAGAAAPPAPAPPAPVVLPERLRTWNPDEAESRFQAAGRERPYDPEADAAKAKALEDALHRGRRGKRPRSAEDED